MSQEGEQILIRLNTCIGGLLGQSIAEDWKTSTFENCLKLKNAQHLEEIAISLKELAAEMKKFNAITALRPHV